MSPKLKTIPIIQNYIQFSTYLSFIYKGAEGRPMISEYKFCRLLIINKNYDGGMESTADRKKVESVGEKHEKIGEISFN